jgi:hypothetical protein
MKTSSLFLIFAISALSSMTLRAAVNWVESVDGDLSSSNVLPTPLSFGIGTNTITGTMGADAGEGIPLDRDFFTFTLAPGQSLSSITVLAFSPAGQSFYAIGSGTTIDITNPALHLSNALINGTGDYLPTLAAGAYSGGTGLSSPVGSGTYIVWFQELASVVEYSMAYEVVPEPSVSLCAIAGMGLLLVSRRRSS